MSNRLIIRSFPFFVSAAIAFAAPSVMAQEEQSLEAQFEQANAQLRQLRVSNSLLRSRVERQDTLLANLEESITAAQTLADEEESPLLPLMDEMMTSLEEFVESDLPFEIEERREQLDQTRELLNNDDANIQQKMQRLLTLYQAEALYGIDMDTYEDTLQIDGSEYEVDMVRIGRIVLAYQSQDRTQTGVWDNEAREWVSLSPGQYRTAIRRAYEVASNQRGDEILRVPIAAPEPADAQSQ